MNIILWIQSGNSTFFSNAINVLARQYRNINFVGTVHDSTVTPSPKNSPIMINNKPIPVVRKENLFSINYDIIVVVGQDASLVPILKEADQLKINPDKVILDRTICVPGFTVELYKKLRNSKLSILSINCWGGLIYHTFGLPFLSPTINMFFGESDFLKFLHNPNYYMEKELRFYKMSFDKNLKCNYPIFLLGDIKLYMNHYGDVGIDGAREKWEERRLKINWFNLFIMNFTNDIHFLKEFDQLPYSKKICFVPFETDIDSGVFINSNLIQNKPFYEAVNETAMNKITCYNLWDLLLYGKKTKIDM